MFPLSAAGTVSAPAKSVSIDAVLLDLTERLARYKPTCLSRHEHTVSFEAGPLRFVWSSNLLVAISSGTVSVGKAGDDITITYRLRFNEVVIAGSLISFFLAHNSPLHWVSHLAVFVGYWLFLVGGNYLLSLHWFRHFLKKVLKDVANKPTSFTPVTGEK